MIEWSSIPKIRWSDCNAREWSFMISDISRNHLISAISCDIMGWLSTCGFIFAANLISLLFERVNRPQFALPCATLSRQWVGLFTVEKWSSIYPSLCRFHSPGPPSTLYVLLTSQSNVGKQGWRWPPALLNHTEDSFLAITHDLCISCSSIWNDCSPLMGILLLVVEPVQAGHQTAKAVLANATPVTKPLSISNDNSSAAGEHFPWWEQKERDLWDWSLVEDIVWIWTPPRSRFYRPWLFQLQFPRGARYWQRYCYILCRESSSIATGLFK